VNAAPVSEDSIAHPNFIRRTTGRVYCTTHTLFDKAQLVKNESEPLIGRKIMPSMSCRTCGHFLGDTCYFDKLSIERIDRATRRRAIPCDLCPRWRVAWPLVVHEKIYF